MRTVQRLHAATFEPLSMRVFDLVTRRGVRSAYRWLLKTQQLDRAGIQALQERQLERLFAHAFEHSPFYRARLEAAGWSPDTEDTRAVLGRLPALEKDDLQSSLAAVSTVPRWRARYTTSNTGGTTGEPTTFYVDFDARDRRVAGTLRDQTWLGLRPGDPIAYLGGSSLGVPRRERGLERIKWLARNQLFLSAWDLSDAAMAGYADRLERFRPRLLLGYAGALHTFARYLDRVGRRVPVRVVQATAEMLYPEWRPVMERAFGSPVYQRYGTREVGDIAASCAKCGELHVNDENLLLEEADTGEIYITDLTNFATPFLRYRIGDRGCLGEPLAGCRPGLSRVVSLEGRTMDVLESAGGGRVSAVILVHALKEFSELRGHQLWQPTPDRIQVLVAADTEPPCERIREAFAPHFDGVAIEVIWVDQLPTTAGGKLRFVVRGAEYAGPRRGE